MSLSFARDNATSGDWVRALADRITEHLIENLHSRREGREIRFRCPMPDHEDADPSARWNPTKAVWHCFPCGAGGGAHDLAIRLSLMDPARPPLRPQSRARSRLRSPRGPVTYPPQEEVRELWMAGCFPNEVDQASAWLHSRGLCPIRIADLDLARVLPDGVPCPVWARYRGRSWSESAYRLIVPTFDARGRVSSLRARSLDGGSPKELAPARYSVRGLVLACALGRLLLSGHALADGSDAADAVRTWGMAIVEGIPDWLTWATRWTDAREDSPAIIGIVSGSFTPEIAARIPNGTRIAIRTHPDTAGDRYAWRIEEMLRRKCQVSRRRGN